MKQQEIKYIDIIDAGFTEEIHYDKVYRDKYGFEWAIIQKWLTDTIYLSWEKENRLCYLKRIDNEDEQNIVGQMPIMNFKHLETIINFFAND